MTTDFFSNVFGGKFAATVFLLSALATGLLTMGNVQAEGIVAGGLPLNEMFYEGTVDSVHPDTFGLIIDDRPFVLDRVVDFRGASWSREQAIRQIDQGSVVKLELGAEVDTRSGARAVQSIIVIDR